MRETELEVLLCKQIIMRELETWDKKKTKKERNSDNWNKTLA